MNASCFVCLCGGTSKPHAEGLVEQRVCVQRIIAESLVAPTNIGLEWGDGRLSVAVDGWGVVVRG